MKNPLLFFWCLRNAAGESSTHKKLGEVHSSTQSSKLIPGTRMNSLVLCVTTVIPLATPCAAI